MENKIKELEEKLLRKEQECEDLKGRLKCIINENKVLKDCANDKDIDIVALTNYISTLEFSKDKLKAENEELIRRITKIFACLIKANRTNKIVDTLWVDNITTLWDYIAQTLGIEGDQVQIEEQILQKLSEVEDDNK